MKFIAEHLYNRNLVSLTLSVVLVLERFWVFQLGMFTIVSYLSVCGES